MILFIGAEPQEEVRMCRGCGCDDHNACVNGCTWILLDLFNPTGICSRCGEAFGWDPHTLATENLG